MASIAVVKEPAWHASFPPPRNPDVEAVTREELLALFKADENLKGYVLVDLRRTDYEGGTIHTSINLPAQSLYHTIPSLYKLFSAAGIKKVVWYCGSSKGRGSRAAGWFVDYIQDQGDEKMKSVILKDGIAGWAKAGEEYTEFMDGYQQEAWL